MQHVTTDQVAPNIDGAVHSDVLTLSVLSAGSTCSIRLKVKYRRPAVCVGWQTAWSQLIPKERDFPGE